LWKDRGKGIFELITTKFNFIHDLKIGVKTSSNSFYALQSKIDDGKFEESLIDDNDSENLLIKNRDLFQPEANPWYLYPSELL